MTDADDGGTGLGEARHKIGEEGTNLSNTSYDEEKKIIALVLIEFIVHYFTWSFSAAYKTSTYLKSSS